MNEVKVSDDVSPLQIWNQPSVRNGPGLLLGWRKVWVHENFTFHFLIYCKCRVLKSAFPYATIVILPVKICLLIFTKWK